MYFTVQNGEHKFKTFRLIVNTVKTYMGVRPLTIFREGSITPKKGYKSITVKAEVYDYFYSEWLKVKDQYLIQRGIRSFSAYVTFRLAQLMAEDKKQASERKTL